MLTIEIPDDQPGGPVLVLRWVVLRLFTAIDASPVPIRIRVEREDSP